MNLHTLQDVEEYLHAQQLPHLAIQDHHGDPYLISESGQIDEQGRLFWVGIPEGDEDGNRSTDGTGWLHDGPHDDGPSWPFTTLLPSDALPDSEHTWGWVTEMPPSTPTALAADANKIADLVSAVIGGPAAWVPWSVRYGIAYAVLGAGYRMTPVVESRTEAEHTTWKILRDLGMSPDVADEALRLLERFRGSPAAETEHEVPEPSAPLRDHLGWDMSLQVKPEPRGRKPICAICGVPFHLIQHDEGCLEVEPQSEPSDALTIPRPHVPYGPVGVPEHQADADYLEHAASSLESHYEVGGSNVRATVVAVLRDVATALRAAGGVR